VHLHTVELGCPTWALDLRDRYDRILATDRAANPAWPFEDNP
jgi:hypothetical protein